MFSRYKILRHPERLTEWMRTGRTTGPIGFDLQLTSRCPHKCPHCNGPTGTAMISAKHAKTILSDFKKLGAKAVHLTGGEPLLHPDVAEIARYAKAIGLSVGLITNLYRMPEKSLVDSCRWIRVSLDARTDEEYQRMHGVPAGEYELTLDRIRQLVDVKGKCMVGIGMLGYEETDLQAQLGVDYVQSRGLNEIGFSGDCQGVHFWTIVGADLKLRLCCESRDENAVFADLRKESVESAWAKVSDAMAGLDRDQCALNCRMNKSINGLLFEISGRLLHEEHI